MMRRVICLSGGLDSSITSAMLSHNSILFPLFFDYNQPSKKEELNAAKQVVDLLDIQPLTILKIPDLILHFKSNENKSVASSYYIPHRNLIFATLAQNFASSVGAAYITFGFVADTDPNIFPDATNGFADSLNQCLQNIYKHAGDMAFIEAPNARKYKRDLIRYAAHIKFPCQITYSCYFGGNRCGECPACVAVKSAFLEAQDGQPNKIVSILENMNPYLHMNQDKNMNMQVR